jgi:hypothetical protein
MRSVSRAELAAAVTLSLLAAAIHLSVAPSHFSEWWGYGTFFVLVAAGECAFPVLLALRPRRWVIKLGVWGSLATMLMFLLSRTSGIPLGPQTGVVEPVELLGVAATLAEGALVVLLCGLLGGRDRRRTFNALAAIGACLWVAALSGALAPPAQPVGGHRQDAAAHNEAAARGLPVIPESVRSGPRPPGDG